MTNCFQCRLPNLPSSRTCVRCRCPLPAQLCEEEVRPATALLVHLRKLKEQALAGQLGLDRLAGCLENVRQHCESTWLETEANYAEQEPVWGWSSARSRVLEAMERYLEAVELMALCLEEGDGSFLVQGLAQAELVDADLQQALDREANESGNLVRQFSGRWYVPGLRDQLEFSPQAADLAAVA